MSSAESLARFAVLHSEMLPPVHRADLLEAAAEHLPEPKAGECRTLAFHLREAEARQLKLKMQIEAQPLFESF